MLRWVCWGDFSQLQRRSNVLVAFFFESAGAMCGDLQLVLRRGDGGPFLVGGGAGRLVRLPALFAGRCSGRGGVVSDFFGRGGVRGNCGVGAAGVGSGVCGRSVVSFAVAKRRHPWSLAFPDGGCGALGLPSRESASGPRRLASPSTLVAKEEGSFPPGRARGLAAWPPVLGFFGGEEEREGERDKERRGRRVWHGEGFSLTWEWVVSGGVFSRLVGGCLFVSRHFEVRGHFNTHNGERDW